MSRLTFKTSIKYFERGIYHCSVELVTFFDNEDSELENLANEIFGDNVEIK